MSEREDFIPKRLSEYRERGYWERRYAQEQSYEWFFTFSQIDSYLNPHLRSHQRILILGCGFSEELLNNYQGLHLELVDLDYSWNVLDSIRKKQRPDTNTVVLQEWICADMRSLPFKEASFDLIIDKATLDAIWSHEASSVWDPLDVVKDDVNMVVREILRVLRPNGLFLSFSFGQPHFRRPLLERPGRWDLQVRPIEGTWYFFYELHKLDSQEGK